MRRRKVYYYLVSYFFEDDLKEGFGSTVIHHNKAILSKDDKTKIEDFLCDSANFEQVIIHTMNRMY